MRFVKAFAAGLTLANAEYVADAAQQPDVTGGALKLAYSDCGDGATHGKFTSLSPTSVSLGNKTPLKGKGTIDENIQAATYEVDAKALFVTVFKHSGDACKAESIRLPAGAGTIDMHGFRCPLARGDVELDLDLSLAGSIPSSLARLTIDLKATTSTGDKALCAQIKTSPAAEETAEVFVEGRRRRKGPSGPCNKGWHQCENGECCGPHHQCKQDHCDWTMANSTV